MTNARRLDKGKYLNEFVKLHLIDLISRQNAQIINFNVGFGRKLDVVGTFG